MLNNRSGSGPYRPVELVRAGGTAGALLLDQRAMLPGRLLHAPDEQAASRFSRLFRGRVLVHGDLHNHSRFSDGQGDPEQAFETMRAAGLDAAALTDHSTLSFGQCEPTCFGTDDCRRLAGLYEASWRRSGELADQALRDGQFVALRGFEWTSPSLGHLNVWFSERWIDPLHTAGTIGGQGDEQFDDDLANFDPTRTTQFDAVLQAVPAQPESIQPFYDWLQQDPTGGPLGGGCDGLVGFNHPGREPGRFSAFAFESALQRRMVSLEAFNRNDDYLFEGTDSGQPSPISQCLDRGWRVGLLGVSDEHGPTWGCPGRGRAGLWVRSLTRAGLREALEARRFFATREAGLRFAAVANGVPMGGSLPFAGGTLRLEIDIAHGRSWTGKRLNLQLLAAGDRLPRIVDTRDIRVLADDQEPLTLSVAVDPVDSRWLVLRVSDPAEPADRRASGVYASLGSAVAYSSPFFVESGS